MDPIKLNPLSSNEIGLRHHHIYYTHETPILEPELAEALSSVPREILIANSWSDLIGLLIKYNPMSICVNVKNFEGLSSLTEILDMIKTFSKVTRNGGDMTITLGVNHDTPYKIVKEAQLGSILGIVPDNTCFGWRETVKGLHAQFAGITYWPQHIIDQLPGRYDRARPKVDNIELTPRQQQIYNLVSERGISNKLIGRMLNLSESTVKLHMGAIFKKFGVKNRTQLAVFAKNNLTPKKNNQTLTKVENIQYKEVLHSTNISCLRLGNPIVFVKSN